MCWFSKRDFSIVGAEYLAKGYILSDHILERAIDIDSESVLSNHRCRYIANDDEK
jgi:hypothetical protein